MRTPFHSMDETLTIDKNISMADYLEISHVGRSAKDRYLFAATAKQMVAGDSVYVKNSPDRSALLKAINRLGGEAISRRVDDEGYRIWRIK